MHQLDRWGINLHRVAVELVAISWHHSCSGQSIASSPPHRPPWCQRFPVAAIPDRRGFHVVNLWLHGMAW
ncbi:uncharacterized protein LAESUDRAFT_304370 [Laetiporus sulphureus 93-53]|uniref:Uncharacterized protein n=1 Tax=Laetiporus sulphureus 93-53 TaxID=1314785 RepID=A0A165D886_9APHY|nr:uncharacterized protein LAESUDRAFT_304370 [Laetiporus sulphureus 93-53]KZT04312.1 hypothetical protein LAESUDRAFT_304370 [Laetiporus sulphureus 93-53]